MPVRLDRDYEPLPGYRLIERLGRGGFGEVWKVEAPGQLMKAMKFVFGNLDTQDDDEGRPAEQELKALNRVKSIRHPYILSLERIDIIDGQLIIVMELADRNLWDRYRECRQQKHAGVPREELLRYMSEAAEALDLMNDEYHIQHLDIKPQNLFLLYNHLKVADFGLAKAFEGGRGTITGGVTPVYAAPETFEGYASRYTDQYSLAIVYQELLTGTRPFNGSNTKQLLMQHLNGVPDLSALPSGDKPVIARALNKKPDERWPNCREMIQALRQSALGDTPLPAAVHVANPSAKSANTRPQDEMAETLRTRIKVGDHPPPKPGSLRGGSGTRGNMPRLVTPRGAAAGRPGSASFSQTNRPDGETIPIASLVPAPPEMTGDGSLFPALIIGVGHHGRLVVQRLRLMLRDEFGSLDAIPHIRYLYLDTDSEEMSRATSGQNDNALSPRDAILARLNRPAHYLQREGLPSVEQWMPQGLLYKLPKEPKNSCGIRAYGRLALFDHYRMVSARLRAEIREFTSETILSKAIAETGRGLRTNRPRVYVIASTTGGTGSGMVLDLAYLVRHELRLAGYAKPQVCGVLFVPPADKTKPKSAALSNSYATLAELNHYATDGTVYQARFDNNEPPIVDPDPPFVRCATIQIPSTPNSSKLGRTIGLVARSLSLDLVTPVGRVTDGIREEAFALPRRAVPVVQTYGMFRFTWPRRELHDTLTRRFGSQLLARWAGRDVAHLRDPIRHWLGEQWDKRELELEQLVEKLQLAIELGLREKPERVFDAYIEPLRVRLLGAGQFDDAATCDVLEELLKLVGHPNPKSNDAGKLDETLHAKGKMLAIESEGHLSALAVSFIEQPQYRFAGAEEALAQISDKLKHTIETLDNVQVSLLREVYETYQRIFAVIQTLSKDETGFFGGKRAAFIHELCDLLGKYPRCRLKLSVLETARHFYHGLLEQCPDFQREITACRNRLTELARRTAVAPPVSSASADEPTAIILPPGCATLDDAADEFLNALTPDEILTFEKELQHQISRKFRGVVSVCTKLELTDNFLDFFADRSREFLEPRIERADPAAIFFRYKDGQSETARELESSFDDASPDLTTISGAAPVEATVLAAPAGPSGDQLRQFVSQHLQGMNFIPATLESDVVFYREYPLLEISALPQLAAHARDAYTNRLGTDAPPHARIDIPWDPPASGP
jgi:serine/threonine protein kinase